MITKYFSTNSLAEMEISLRQAAEDQGYTILGVYDLSGRLRDKGYPTRHEVRVFELCHPATYCKMLERDPVTAAVLPFRIAAHAVEGGVQLSAISLAPLAFTLDLSEADPLLLNVEMRIREIMAAASKPRQAPAPPASRQRIDPSRHQGAMEGQMDRMRGQIPQRIDRKGTKVEDLAGTGVHDAQGG